ncbi:MAG TPA: hypothetical protein VGK79_05985 [Gaiellaceae bacterium]
MPTDCRACVTDVRAALTDLPTRAEREPVVGTGLGGDETTAIDKAAEDAILARLRTLEEPLTAAPWSSSTRSTGR